MRLHWHHREFRKEPYQVLFVDRIVCPESGRLLLGYIDFDVREVLIDATLDDDQIGPTYIHECLHGLSGNASCERFIRTIDMGLWALMVAGGYKLPRKPSGFRDFQERAQFARGSVYV